MVFGDGAMPASIPKMPLENMNCKFKRVFNGIGLLSLS